MFLLMPQHFPMHSMKSQIQRWQRSSATPCGSAGSREGRTIRLRQSGGGLWRSISLGGFQRHDCRMRPGRRVRQGETCTVLWQAGEGRRVHPPTLLLQPRTLGVFRRTSSRIRKENFGTSMIPTSQGKTEICLREFPTRSVDKNSRCIES